MTSNLRELTRYAMVGVLNTVVGLFVIWGLMFAGFTPTLSNFGGYMVGLTLAFFLNRSWTFQVRSEMPQVFRYILAFGVAYSLNLIVLSAGLRIFDEIGFVAQLPAVCTYTVVFYFLSKYYVFASTKP